jgi:ABC-2 type transport system ATP-binding protein
VSAPAIETVGLTKFYGETRGIERLDLRVERGEVFGYLGPNGAGKTTTIRLLLDLIRPTSGRAAIAGLDTRRQSVEVRRVTGYLPGELKLPARATAIGYLTYLGGLRGGVDRRAIGDLAERLDLPLERRLGDLSKGNKQKVGVVAALMHDPQLLVMDEPTSGLDPLRQHDVLELVRARAAAGRTVFFSSHELDQVEHVAERVGIVRDGRLVAVEAMSTLRQRALRRVEVRLAGPSAEVQRLRDVPGVRDLTVGDGVVRLGVEGSMDALVKELARLPVQTLTSEAPELDEIFRSYYGGADAD